MCRKDSERKMSDCPSPLENGAKVNMIKQKFEQHLWPKEKVALPPLQQQYQSDRDERKEAVRRSLSASPVKSKKSLTLNVSRQLSNPGGKNIKRTPAFRGDKLSRTKNLQSPTKERHVSIVNQNVKIFEESPEYGRIGNVKRKMVAAGSDERLECGRSASSAENVGLAGCSSSATRMDRAAIRRGYIEDSPGKEAKPVMTKGSRIGLNESNTGVRTTVISRQKNISPIYRRDEDFGGPTRTNGGQQPSNSWESSDADLEKFLKNGAEYTKVMKANKTTIIAEDKQTTARLTSGKENAAASSSTTLDVREELSRRINRASSDVVDAAETADGIATRRKLQFRATAAVDHESPGLPEKSAVDVDGLSDTLKAALQAPLPAGPPPKKPPRTFLHNPGSNALLSLEEEAEEQAGEDSRSRRLASERIETSRGRDSSRDSKKMLEKLEHVLIQHQKALGAKVIMPRKPEKLDVLNPAADDETNSHESKEKRCCRRRRSNNSSFENRLSRTLEDPRKLGSATDRRVSSAADSRARKHSTFECLPSLNCASWTSVYEQVRSPDFKSYFEPETETETSSLRESESSISKSEDSLESLVSAVGCNPQLLGGSESKRSSSTELSTFREAKKRGPTAEERVYAEPFAFDKNSGTDITGFAMLTSDQHNYFSRSLQEERFGRSNSDNILPLVEQRRSLPRLNDDTAVVKPELHYMCTSIQPMVYEDNNNELEIESARSKIAQRASGVEKKKRPNLTLLNLEDCRRAEPDKLNTIKVEQLLNQAFGKFAMAGSETPNDSNNSSDTDSLASSASISDQMSSFNEKLRLFKNRENGEKPTKDEVHRSLTEKRKNYVRRVSSKFSERREGGSFVGRRDKLFQVCLLVELNLSTREPYIKDKYPAYAKTPAWIENFCFPDATDWPPSDSNQNQFYSLVLMDERGNRRYGYCCRVRPEDGPILPLAYCLITKYRASGFYHKVLLELESRHGLPDRKRTSFIDELYNSPMPMPGQCLRLAVDEAAETPTATSSLRGFATTTSNSKFNDSNDKRSNVEKLHQKSAQLTSSSALLANERDVTARMTFLSSEADFGESVIVRSSDPRLEERDMSQLFDAVSNKVLIILFGSLLLERKVVLLCEKLSKLSSCVDALQSLLYPFTWQHTFVPVLPDIPGLSEILQAPLPFVIGILKSKNSKTTNTDIASIRDGIVVDLDTSKVVYAVGDESSILPPRLQKGIRSALQLVSSHTKSGDGIRNFLVSEAFLRVLVETCSHYDSHLVTQQDGKVIFQKESFIKSSSSSKTVQYFLEWFVETTMFISFIQDCIGRMEDTTNTATICDVKLFNQRAAEFRKRSGKSTETSKNGCAKKKTLGDRLKDLTNFHT